MRYLIRLIAICCASLFLTCHAHAGTFKNPLFIPTAYDLLGLATADLNHDGKLDLIYMDGQPYTYGNPALHVLLGNGDGTFVHGQDISLPNGICYALGCVINVADVTNDGNVDLIFGGQIQGTPEIVVLVGNGDGTFQAPIITALQASPNLYPNLTKGIAVGDVNGDGAADLIVSDTMNGLIYVLLGDNTGNFRPGTTLLTYASGPAYLADLNGDGHLDIIATDPLGNRILVFLGNGDGTFQTPVSYSPYGNILRDMDGDGHPDLITVVYPGQVTVLKGNPDGTFGLSTVVATVPSGTSLVGLGDYNGDGILDLTFLTPTGVGVMLGKGNLTYGPMQMSVSGSAGYVHPALGSFSEDGRTDIAMAVEGGIAILLGKGDGTFASADFYDMGQPVGAVGVADFNGDGFPDIAVTLPATFPRLLLGNGTGTFTLGPDPNPSYGSQSPDTNIEAADFDGDGKMDLDMGTQTLNAPLLGTQSVAFGNGDGTFKTPTVISNGSPIVADFNNDGRSDIVSFSGNTVIVLLGQANGSFTTVTTSLRIPGNLWGVGDVNNDGKPDLVINYSDHLEVWLGKGDGTFSYFGSIGNQGLGYSPIAAVADLDGDGNADIILGPGPNPDPFSTLGSLTVFYGNGDGTFQAPISLPISHRYSQVVVKDLNGDNKPDLVMTDGSAIAVMMNLGGRKFDSETYYVAGQSVSWLNVVDVNGDGFPDIVVANPGGTTVTVLLNQSNGTSPEGAVTIGSLTVSPEPSVSGQSFTISLTVSGLAHGMTVPTGSVSFSIDGAFLAAVPLVNGSASYAYSDVLIPISHTIVATYSGDAAYAPKSFATLHVVQPPTYTTLTALTAAPATVLASQTVRLVATVASTPPVPSGVVTFFDGSNSLGAATINSSGIAYRDTALLAVGVHSLTAKFQGYTQYGFDFNTSYVAALFSPSTSSPVTVIVNTDATSTLLSASSTSPTAGTVLTLTANVQSPAGVPFGGVSFYDGSTLLGTMALDTEGVASFSTASLGTGTHALMAGFNSNGPFAGSSSSPVPISVLVASAASIPSFISLRQETNPDDRSSTLTANVSASQGTPVGTVTFLDSGVILGTAHTDPSGTAVLRVDVLSSGNHSLTANFTSGSEFAPSVSPELRDQWPATGPGFSLNFGARTLRVSPAGSDPLQVRIVSLPLFQGQVLLSCAGGLPEGYTCDFSPSAVTGGGVSTFKIRPSAKSANALPEAIPLYAIALGLISVALLGSWTRHPRWVVILVLLGCTVGMTGGCGTVPPSGTHTQIVVLTVRAASGTGPEAIIHSAQIQLIVPGSD